MNNNFRIFWRGAVILICALLLIATLSTLVGEVREWLDSKNRGTNIESYDYYLYDGEYMKLKERLEFYRPRGEAFQVYWEVADAYEDYSVYEFWRLAAEDGMDTGGYGQEHLDAFWRIYGDSGEDARRLIDVFAAELIR